VLRYTPKKLTSSTSSRAIGRDAILEQLAENRITLEQSDEDDDEVDEVCSYVLCLLCGVLCCFRFSMMHLTFIYAITPQFGPFGYVPPYLRDEGMEMELGQLARGMYASRSTNYNLDIHIEMKKIPGRVEKLPEAEQW
jgi:hypothetical protein